MSCQAMNKLDKSRYLIDDESSQRIATQVCFSEMYMYRNKSV